MGLVGDAAGHRRQTQGVLDAGSTSVQTVIEVVPGSVDTDGFARIYSEVGRWTTLTPEHAEHERRTHSSLRDWLALVGGEAVGAALCVETPDMRKSAALYGGVRVLAGSRRQGVGTELFRVLSEYASTLGKSELEVFAYEDDPDGVAFAERRGFTTVMRLRMLRLVLAGLPAPGVDPPEGVTIATLADRPELEHRVVGGRVRGAAGHAVRRRRAGASGNARGVPRGSALGAGLHPRGDLPRPRGRGRRRVRAAHVG